MYLRGTTHVLGTTDGYLPWYAHASGVGSGLRAYRVDNGVLTQLGAQFDKVLANGDDLGGEIIGSTLKVYYNTGAGWIEGLSRTDSTYTAAGFVGLRVFSDVNPMDDFGGGTVVAGAGRTTKNTDQHGLGIAPGVSRMVKAGVGF